MLAGAIAICAMILPGISGSFILLLIGMYAPVLAAVKGFQIDILALFLVGCVGGLLSFSHLLSWLLKRFRDFTLMFLVGLMIGTLPKIWPWKQTLTWRTNSSGEQVPLIQENLTPHTFESIFNTSSQLPLAIVMMLVAIGMVLALEKIADK
ncbi:membrane protein [Vibrio ishigakensis]|uniref:Membrane protein n=1 Tax=Vibrio ishigakensis TaxID=1481914 RepID=A0A0B8PJI4_9VIBR|nr:membrane protein [Vibrio ishigakensis]